MKTIDQTISALKQLQKDVQYKVAVKATRETAKEIAKEARAFAPKRTGALRESIRAVKTKKYAKYGHIKYLVLPKRKLLTTAFKRRSKVRFTKRNVYTKNNGRKYLDPYYAHFVELGTEKMRARPYLKPAAEKVAPYALEFYTSKLDEAIKKAAR